MLSCTACMCLCSMCGAEKAACLVCAMHWQRVQDLPWALHPCVTRVYGQSFQSGMACLGHSMCWEVATLCRCCLLLEDRGSICVPVCQGSSATGKPACCLNLASVSCTSCDLSRPGSQAWQGLVSHLIGPLRGQLLWDLASAMPG